MIEAKQEHPEIGQFISESPHSFHIPVMGTGFTIDTPLRVGRFGISSVISLVDDELIEQMRAYYVHHAGEKLIPIRRSDHDARAKRIEAYLNLVNHLLNEQVACIRRQEFSPDSELTQYFEMLPDGLLKSRYEAMLKEPDPASRTCQEEALRGCVVPGSIDVNIMTKLDRPGIRNGQPLPPEYSDALAALRGFADSTLQSTIVLSAGVNQRLFNYMSVFKDFFPGKGEGIRKKVALKVSDYRSAEVQGRLLAKNGIWVSEFRVESGLNCGGHAFATKGLLLGPILEEFRANRRALSEKLFAACCKAWKSRDNFIPETPPPVRLTVQGGIGTAEENRFLFERYGVDSTGWGSPFLMVPEATRVEENLLNLLQKAELHDIYLSDSSPLGIRYWNFRHSPSEQARLKRISLQRPGSPCVKGFVATNTEFTTNPICTASHAYQKKKMEALESQGLAADELQVARSRVLEKSCICHDLGGSAANQIGADNYATPAICPGPNTIFFKRVASLKEMIDHIYGRMSLLIKVPRKHMFMNELGLYYDYLRTEWNRFQEGCAEQPDSYYQTFRDKLLEGIGYYEDVAEAISIEAQAAFRRALDEYRGQVNSLGIPATPSES